MVLAIALAVPVTTSAAPNSAKLLYDAAASGNVQNVAAVLDTGVPVDSEFHGIITPLVVAVTSGYTDVIKLLIERGAEIDRVSSHYKGGPGPTALSHAAAGGRADIAKILISKGADIDKAIVGLEFQASSGAGDLKTAITSRMGIEFLKGLRGKSEPVDAATVAAPQPVQPVEKVLPVLAPKYSNAPALDDYAVIVGIEKYPDLPAATYAERDASAARNFIRAMGVPERNIMFLAGNRATKTGMEKVLEAWLPNNVSEKSRVYFYYSGHGAPDTKTGDAYLVPSDGDPQYLAQTGYPLKRLYAKLGALKAKSVLVALDSCFSGAGGRSVLAKGTRPLVGKVDMAVQTEGKVSVISASAGDQISGANDEAGYGLFTYNFLQGLNGAAKDAQGQVTLKSLYGYLKPRVQDDARRGNRDQTPQLQGGGDDLILRAK